MPRSYVSIDYINIYATICFDLADLKIWKRRLLLLKVIKNFLSCKFLVIFKNQTCLYNFFLAVKLLKQSHHCSDSKCALYAFLIKKSQPKKKIIWEKF